MQQFSYWSDGDSDNPKADAVFLKELAHRQQFFFWKNYRNNRLKFILPKPPPEPVAAPALPPPAAIPPQPPVPATTIALTTAPPAPASALSPMPYGLPPVSSLAKNDMRNSGIDRRKRKHERSLT
ncbi:hypothetical protein CRYUN_Cryun07bG0011000 [Craigia yunnanensis]